VATISFLIAACRGAESPPAKAPGGTATRAAQDVSPHQSGFITVNGARLNVLDWGGAGPALVLIHGFGQSPHVFDDFAPEFTDRHRVVAYARRGHGRSEAKPPYDTARLTEDLRELLDSLKITRASLAGWSMGGNEVTAFAGRYPDRVDRIVYLDGAYDWGDPEWSAAVQNLPPLFTPDSSILQSYDRWREWARATYFAGEAPDNLEGFFQDLVIVEPSGRVETVPLDTVAAELRKVLFSDRRDYTKVKAPALAIYVAPFLSPNQGDSATRSRIAEWETRYVVSFRTKSKERIQRELPKVRIVDVAGTHGNFIFHSRRRVVEVMREFLGPTG